jgi:hypothetical protein
VNTVAAHHDAALLIFDGELPESEIFGTPPSEVNNSSDDETGGCGGGVTLAAFLRNAKNDQNLYRVRAIILVCIQVLNRKNLQGVQLN